MKKNYRLCKTFMLATALGISSCVMTSYANSIGNPATQNEQQQTITVKGVVNDNQGIPLPGVSILVKGSSAGTATDGDGRFQLNVNPRANLILSYLGYTSIEVKAKEQMTITMAEKHHNAFGSNCIRCSKRNIS